MHSQLQLANVARLSHCRCTLRRELILNKQKVITAQASSAYKHALQEVLESPGVIAQIKARTQQCPAA